MRDHKLTTPIRYYFTTPEQRQELWERLLHSPEAKAVATQEHTERTIARLWVAVRALEARVKSLEQGSRVIKRGDGTLGPDVATKEKSE